MPWAAGPAAVTVRPPLNGADRLSGSTSLASTSTLDAELSSATVAVSATGAGASATGVTVRVTVSEVQAEAGSHTMYVNSSAPLKFAFGVYERPPRT